MSIDVNIINICNLIIIHIFTYISRVTSPMMKVINKDNILIISNICDNWDNKIRIICMKC